MEAVSEIFKTLFFFWDVALWKVGAKPNSCNGKLATILLKSIFAELIMSSPVS
jgi:hypothetical protein